MPRPRRRVAQVKYCSRITSTELPPNVRTEGTALALTPPASRRPIRVPSPGRAWRAGGSRAAEAFAETFRLSAWLSQALRRASQGKGFSPYFFSQVKRARDVRVRRAQTNDKVHEHTALRRRAGRGARRAHVSGAARVRAALQPRVQPDRILPARARRGARPDAAAARTPEVPLHLLREPGRVLHDPRLRLAGDPGGPGGRAFARRDEAARTTAGDPRAA